MLAKMLTMSSYLSSKEKYIYWTTYRRKTKISGCGHGGEKAMCFVRIHIIMQTGISYKRTHNSYSTSNDFLDLLGTKRCY